MARKLGSVLVPHLKGTQLSETIQAQVPKKVVIPMCMSMGTHAEPTVNIGDAVKAGQIIAQSTGFFALPIHASVSGKVNAFGVMQLGDGKTCKTVEIEADENQELYEGIKPPQINNKEEFINAVKESGICGLGGAGFPAYVKLATDKEIDTLIINAAECEPYITSDCREILEKPDDVISGILLILKWINIPKAYIAIESNKPEAVEILTEKTRDIDNIEIFVLPSEYPQGAEKVIIYSVTKRVVEFGKFPADFGVAVMNVSTVSAINRYCQSGVPMIKRRVTVEGDCVKNPCNIECYIGTSAKELFEAANTNFSKAKRIVFGGLMMGNCKINADAPIVKTTNAILALSAMPRKTQTSCIRCSRCINACPLGLMPTQIEQAYNAKDIAALKRLNVAMCMSCASCSYVCPANRDLAQTNQLAKALLPRD